MHLGQHVDLLVLLIQQILQFPHFGLQRTYSLLQRFGISTRERSSTELVAGLALEADVGTLRAAGSYAIAAYLLAATAITGLGNPALRTRPNLDHFHRKYARHSVECEWCPEILCHGRTDSVHSRGPSQSQLRMNPKPIKRCQAAAERKRRSYCRRMVAVWRDGGFDSRRESVERRRGFCEGCEVVGIRCAGWKGRGWDGMG
jgi:hypothetical protein